MKTKIRMGRPPLPENCREPMVWASVDVPFPIKAALHRAGSASAISRRILEEAAAKGPKGIEALPLASAPLAALDIYLPLRVKEWLRLQAFRLRIGGVSELGRRILEAHFAK